MIKNGGILKMPEALKKLSLIEKGATYSVKCCRDIWLEAPQAPYDFRPVDRRWSKSTFITGQSHKFLYPSKE